MTRPLLTAAATFLALACTDATSTEMTRETLPNGRVLVTYSAGLPVREDTLLADIRIGQLDGAPEETFGEIRSVEMDGEGRVYVLDAQASEIRTFAADGNFLSTIARRGEGPGELSRANGILLDREDRLWVNDHGKRSVLVLDLEGHELARHESIVPGFGYLWNAVIDTAGTIWQPWSHPVGRAPRAPDFTGVVEGENRGYFKSFDPNAGTYDSLFTGISAFRGYSASYEGGGWGLPIPFSGGTLSAIDQHRRAWVVDSDTYTLYRMDARGDTSMEVRVTATPDPVTAADIAAWRSGNADVAKQVPDALDAIEKLIPPVKPLMQQLHTDDRSRLWIGRTVPTGAAPLYDVFSPDAEYLGSVRLVAGALGWRPPVVRRDRILMVVAGEDGDHSVVVATLPRALQN